MPKIKIKDGEFEVSTVVATAILAERTDKNREIKTLKDGLTAKEKEAKTLKDSLAKSEKRLKKEARKRLKDSTVNKILEIDDEFSTKEKNPYTIMADYAEIKDKDKRADKAYVESYFDSFIDAKISKMNDSITKKKKKKKVKDSKIPAKKYYKRSK